MYGQFHIQQSLRTSKIQSAKPLNDKKSGPKVIAKWLTLACIILSFSVASFAGSKQSQLKGGNGNAQGR